MALINPRKLPIATALCYKDKLLVSLCGDPQLSLYSLSSLPYPFITSLKLPTNALALEWGVKKDLVLACSDSGVYIIKIEDKSIQVTQKVPGSFTTSAFSYSNEFFVTGDLNGQVKIWNTQSLLEMFTYEHKGTVNGTDMSSDEDLVASASSDKTCAIFSIKYSRVIRNLQFAEHDNSENLGFNGCKFSKSGDLLFTTSSDQYSYLTQWDMHSFIPIATYRMHAAPVKVFTISLDGFFLGLGTTDGWVKILNTRTMDFEKDSEDYSNPVSAITFTFESRHVVTCSGTEIQNVFNSRGEGVFSKASKVWVIFIFVLWIYLYLIG